MRVGLTGGVASGKSTVAALLRDAGAVIVDADVIAREVVAPGTPGLAAIREAFGDAVIGDDGTLDRPAMAAIVFADEGRRRVLEGIVHPLVRRRAEELEMQARAAAAQAGTEPLIVHDIPLLAEVGRAEDFDAVIVVEAPEEEQVRRMIADRKAPEEDARARIAAQATREQRRAIATYVIDNSGTYESLREQVDALLRRLRG
jgi:dephospho-CoA kinase